MPEPNSLDVDRFWADVRRHPDEDKAALVWPFANLIVAAVDCGAMNLQQAGFALMPALSQSGNSPDLSMIGDRAGFLASWLYEDRGQAEDDWRYIVTLVEKANARAAEPSEQQRR